MSSADFYATPVRIGPSSMLMAPAMTLLPFLRRSVGEEIVHPRRVILWSVLLAIGVPCLGTVWCGIATKPPPNFAPLILFALAYFITGAATWLIRRQGLARGQAVHSFDLGQSWVAARLPYPRPVSEIFVIPVAVMSVGYAATYGFLATLGWWLVIAGASLLMLAQWEYRIRRARYRAMVDDVIAAESAQANVRTHEEGGFARRRSGADAAMGNEDDVTADLRKRRKR